MAVRGPRAPPYRRSSVMSAMMLPPPSLPARITSVRVTMIIIDQKINDTRPYTLSVLIGTGSGWLRLEGRLDGGRAGPNVAEHDTQCATEIAM